MIQLDNVKMWEYLIKQSEEYLIFCQIATWLKEALHEQGLEYKDGHIISITKPNADFKIEKGKWYMCIKDLKLKRFSDLYQGTWYETILEKGKSYKGGDNGEIVRENSIGHHQPFKSDNIAEYFRPATEEEIMAIVSIKPEPLSPAPQRNNYDEIKQAEPKQENSPILSNSSNTAKNDELTEFEKELVGMITFAHYGNLEKMKWSDWAIARAKDLLSIARKEIAEGINTEELIKQWEYKKIHSNGFFSSERDRYKEGVEDTIKKIKEG